jgi:hypothetical protein
MDADGIFLGIHGYPRSSAVPYLDFNPPGAKNKALSASRADRAASSHSREHYS